MTVGIATVVLECPLIALGGNTAQARYGGTVTCTITFDIGYLEQGC